MLACCVGKGAVIPLNFDIQKMTFFSWTLLKKITSAIRGLVVGTVLCSGGFGFENLGSEIGWFN